MFYLCTSGNAQNLQLNFFAGTSNYSGDLFFKKSRLPEYNLSKAKLALGAGVTYALTSHVSLRTTFTYGKIGADDKTSGIDPRRNLSFKSSIWDLMIGGQLYLLNPDRYRVVPYAFSGVSFFHFNPHANDRSGNKVYLQPLSTEGQGIIDGREPYKLTQVSIPYGAGLSFGVSENVRVGMELSARKTFTDYLDDVSTTYVDNEILQARRGNLAVEMAFRGDEVDDHAPYPTAGTERGIARFKDRYYFTTISFAFRLNNGGGGRGKGLSCPKFF